MLQLEYLLIRRPMRLQSMRILAQPRRSLADGVESDLERGWLAACCRLLTQGYAR
jgi:hypothetical protein